MSSVPAPRRIYLTGPVRVGRTTIIDRLAAVVCGSGQTVRGFTSRAVRPDGGSGPAVGHELTDLATGERVTVAHRDLPRQPGLGPWGLDLPGFDRFLNGCLGPLDRPHPADLWLIDGIDRLTGSLPRFRTQMADLVERRVPLVATVPGSGGGWLRALKAQPDSAVWPVDGDNRDDLPLDLHRWWRSLADPLSHP